MADTAGTVGMPAVTATPGAASLTVPDRVALLLGVIPWVVAKRGAHLDEITTRFDYPRAQLVKDLEEVVFFVGVHPFTPDALIEVEIDDGFVDIREADWFSHPLRMTPEEATRLLAAGQAVLNAMAGPGKEMSAAADETEAEEADAAEGPLVRALAKLRLALGDDVGSSGYMEVRLGNVESSLLSEVRSATAQQKRVNLEYYSLGRDAVTARKVDPHWVHSIEGKWYFKGWCHRAGDIRLFRVDRIRSVEITDEPAEVLDIEGIEGASESDVVSEVEVGDAGRKVRLRLNPSAAWAADYRRTFDRVDNDDGTIDVTVSVSEDAWLERLLLQLGTGAELLSSEEPAHMELRATAARRVLDRYES